MNLILQANHGLPKLAWLATVDPEKQHATVIHGSWVEVLKQGFIEGAWDGQYSNAAFDQSSCVFGSGAVVSDEAITFVSSTSTTDYLYWWSSADKGHVLVSNSLALLLASLGDELDPHVQEYDLINNSIMSGINRYTREIPTKNGTVNRLMHWNLRVAPGDVSELDKPLPPEFRTFNDYFTYISTCYGRLATNARDPSRSHAMAIFSTQSRGYDATAANAVAKAHGIDQVFTVPNGKARGFFSNEDKNIETNDDGTDICNAFGLTCVPIDRRAVERDSKNEYLFYASLHETGDFNLLQIGAHVLRPTLLITGCLGEVWYTTKYYNERPGIINADLVRGDLSNHSLTEARLQAGYVQLAFPYIGARRREDIFRITESKEMDPWRLRTEYDRPIPRRVAEQAGLPRSMFGQLKMASLLEFPPPTIPIDSRLRRELLAYLIDQRLLSRLESCLLPVIRRWNAIMITTSPRRHMWNYYLQRALSKLLKRSFSFPVLFQRLNGAAYCLCVNRRIVDYRAALK